MRPDIPQHEAERLEAVQQTGLLGTTEHPELDNLTDLVQQIFQVEMVAISLVAEQHQWFCSSVGLHTSKTSREISFCGHVIASGESLYVPDTLSDPRFQHNPLVTGEPYLRSYAGQPLYDGQGHLLGTLCLLDTHPRTYSASEQQQHASFTRQAQALVQRFLDQRQLAQEQQRYAGALERYRTILEEAAAGVIRINQDGIILGVNRFAEKLFGYEPDELLGQNVKVLMPGDIASHHDDYLAAFLAGKPPSIIGKGRQVTGRDKQGHPIPVHLAVSRLSQATNNEVEFIGVLSDLTDLIATREQLQQQSKLLEVLHKGLTDYHALMSGNRLWRFLEEGLRTLTGSKYALIGEVPEGSSSLKIHAITDLSWDQSSRKLLAQLESHQMLLHDPNTMLGQVFAGGKTVITNDFPRDPRRGGQPAGHPALTNYVGVPIKDEGRVIGMFAFANSDETFDEELVAHLEPYTATCALLIKLYRQMHEREQVLGELAQEKERAERASQAKNEFLSAMSHELRTPLNSVLGYAQLMQNSKKHPLPERQQQQARQIYKSGEHLLSLINEVLNLAKIEAGHVSVSMEPIWLHTVADDAVQTMQTLAEQADIRLIHQPEYLPQIQVSVDYTRFKQVLINLLSNAIKYNQPGGEVELKWQTDVDEQVTLVVRDTGIGIPAARQAELFQPFNRLGAENTAIEGTGVGLAITRTLVEQMEGELTFQSEEGTGSTFSVSLPILESRGTTSANFVEQPIAQPLPEPNSLTLQILYIEDNPANQQLMQDIFADYPQIHLTCTHDAKIGLALAREHQPDLILLDINLPGLDGYGALKLARQDPKLQHTRIAALSANALAKDQRKGLAAGFDHYLTKPLDVNELLTIVQQLEQGCDPE